VWERLQWWTFPRTRQLQSCVVCSYPKKTTERQERPPATAHMCTYKSHNLNLTFHEEDARRRRRRWDARRLYNFYNDDKRRMSFFSFFLPFFVSKWGKIPGTDEWVEVWCSWKTGLREWRGEGGYNKWAERKKKTGGIEREKWIEQFLRKRQPVFLICTFSICCWYFSRPIKVKTHFLFSLTKVSLKMLTRRWASVWQKCCKQVLRTSFFFRAEFRNPF